MNHHFALRHADNGLWYGVFSHFAQHGLVHGVSTRLHGYSKEPFKSLNLGLHTGDDKNDVVRNRQLFADAVGIDSQSIVTAQQVHDDHIACVHSVDTDNQTREYQRTFPTTDALATNEPGIPLMLFFADCVPVLFYDPIQHAVAIAHAGWKGTVARIAAKTLVRMQDEFGTRPSDCLIGVGPSIGPCCYEVDETVIDKLRQEFAKTWTKFAIPRKDRWLLDLWSVNHDQLVEVGAADKNIVISGVCTACNTDLYYSYRVENGQTGRIGAVIQL